MEPEINCPESQGDFPDEVTFETYFGGRKRGKGRSTPEDPDPGQTTTCMERPEIEWIEKDVCRVRMEDLADHNFLS
jgi:hypothetical protein